MRAERVILVDEHDRELGEMDKMAAHENGGSRHRAFSVFIFDPQGRWLLQRRADGKYHFPGLWTNACCSHPRPGEPTEKAAHRRLQEELGFDCPLEERFQFEYKALCESEGLTEHELDHVFIGTFCGPVQPHPDEVGAIRWVAPADVHDELQQAPGTFTPWFRIAAAQLARYGDLATKRSR